MSQEQETEAPIYADSPEMDNERLQNIPWSDESQFMSLQSTVNKYQSN